MSLQDILNNITSQNFTKVSTLCNGSGEFSFLNEGYFQHRTLEHNIKEIDSIQPTFEHLGYKNFKYCENCYALFNEGEIIDNSGFYINKAQLQTSWLDLIQDNYLILNENNEVAFNVAKQLEAGYLVIPDNIEILEEGFKYQEGNGLLGISLPNTLKELKANIFLNQLNFSLIIYRGTKEQWSQLKKDPTWNKYAAENTKGLITINCIDGDIIEQAYGININIEPVLILHKFENNKHCFSIDTKTFENLILGVVKFSSSYIKNDQVELIYCGERFENIKLIDFNTASLQDNAFVENTCNQIIFDINNKLLYLQPAYKKW